MARCPSRGIRRSTRESRRISSACQAVAKKIAAPTGQPFVPASNGCEAPLAHDAFELARSALETLAAAPAPELGYNRTAANAETVHEDFDRWVRPEKRIEPIAA